jgi:hypothetical protein
MVTVMEEEPTAPVLVPLLFTLDFMGIAGNRSKIYYAEGL